MSGGEYLRPVLYGGLVNRPRIDSRNFAVVTARYVNANYGTAFILTLCFKNING